MTFLRTEHNYDMLEASNESANRAGLNFDQDNPESKSQAQQHFKEECDINTIVERFGITGEMPQVQNLPAYGDYTGIFDFQTAMNAIRQAEEDFMAYPAKIRARFDNNPQRFLEFCDKAMTDKDSIEFIEGKRLGLIMDRPVAEPPTPSVESNGEPQNKPVPPVQPSTPKAEKGRDTTG